MPFILPQRMASSKYDPLTESLFLRCKPGSDWILSTNAFGKVIEIEPAGN